MISQRTDYLPDEIRRADRAQDAAKFIQQIAFNADDNRNDWGDICARNFDGSDRAPGVDSALVAARYLSADESLRDSTERFAPDFKGGRSACSLPGISARIGKLRGFTGIETAGLNDTVMNCFWGKDEFAKKGASKELRLWIENVKK